MIIISSKVLAVVFLAACVTLVSCGTKKEKSDKKSDKNEKTVSKDSSNNVSVNSSLSWYGISAEDPKLLKLSSPLTEISGITFTPDNRLFAHGDEYADVFELDPESGSILKKFSLGSLLVVKGDFEDITIADGKFYLVESKGKLYQFAEGEDGEFVTYKTFSTELSAKDDVEGLCFDSQTNSLLLACKETPGSQYGKDKVVFSFSLNSMSFSNEPRFIIPFKDIKNNSAEGKFNPSGISRNPLTGTFFVIAARGNMIIELSADGNILGQMELPSSVHRQAEGIAFKTDGTLYISNEGKGKSAVIAVYKVNK
ncbi:MAG: SdiA-regulated domain-containing protein [Ignavibacteria bacterium]|nr:SdiA-regulated domain-containing protein [Ignavibacteria bacterium]